MRLKAKLIDIGEQTDAVWTRRAGAACGWRLPGVCLWLYFQNFRSLFLIGKWGGLLAGVMAKQLVSSHFLPSVHALAEPVPCNQLTCERKRVKSLAAGRTGQLPRRETAGWQDANQQA